jgi:hypothetical protein
MRINHGQSQHGCSTKPPYQPSRDTSYGQVPTLEVCNMETDGQTKEATHDDDVMVIRDPAKRQSAGYAHGKTNRIRVM